VIVGAIVVIDSILSEKDGSAQPGMIQTIAGERDNPGGPFLVYFEKTV
jgi:hypothetical protein